MKYIIYLLTVISVYSMDIEKLSQNKYLVKDYIHIENISPEKGKEILMENMRNEILAYANGININSNSIYQRDSNGNDNFDIVTSQSVDGFILGEKILSQKNNIIENRFVLELEVEFEIGKHEGDTDTNYNIFVSDVENIYREGENLEFQYEVSKDSYVYIFIRDKENNLYRYYPNAINKNNYIKANNKMRFPEKEYDICLSACGENESTESLLVVASKNPIDFVGFEYNTDYGIYMSTYENYIRQIIRVDKGEISINEQVYKVLR